MNGVQLVNMKNNLWIFGCSLSTGFRGEPVDIKTELIWPGILADKLNLKLQTSAHAGQCNWVSILQFIDKRDEFKPGDKVIFEFTFFDRFNIYPTRAQIIDIKEFIIKNKGTLTELNKDIRENNIKWFKKHVYDWCVSNDIEIYFWSIEGQVHIDFIKYNAIINLVPAPNSTTENPNYSFYTKWQDTLPEQWLHDNDRHFNELGHSVLASYFYEVITNSTYNFIYNK